GERIDIVPWSPDPERFARLALAPARVAKVFSDPESKTIQAVVDEDQLSLAIGRNGQNVRLASELTGWQIDLYSSREWLERGGACGGGWGCWEGLQCERDCRAGRCAAWCWRPTGAPERWRMWGSGPRAGEFLWYRGLMRQRSASGSAARR